ncbi:E3 ubiquitin-protein ligase RNF220-like isoform X1 [Orbicella faveolata]|uniref:E3 ubiquitin-protein ligase RNF220-like isoform X1 n=1 Tax=Orbicella faveolata TaxID=48498 RepID=UPI0009E46B7C|nr:E3 ubiquitin-protein ligase RNF220-like isoform X1 [Orbicella faveolata]XP_020628883.1 E3 ubiquitin-protein ligase RNF220-like isoform X1 [Orbicella faveolata]XP_020628891.1 E3 ubiquitin-protein ligase RNF220-like isoform X1 [Orbicella faveolata]
MEKLGGPAYIPNPLTSPALMVLASTAEAARSTASSPGPMNDYHAVYSSPSNRYIDGEAVHRMVLNSTHYQHRSSHLALYPGTEHYAERMPHEFGPHFLQLHHHLGGGLLHKTSGPTAVFNGTGAFRRVVPPEHAFPFHHLQHQRNLLERDHHVDTLYKSSELEKEASLDRASKERISPRKPEKDSDTRMKGDQPLSPSPRRPSSHEESDNNNIEPVSVKREHTEQSECCKSSETDDTEASVDSQSKGRRRSSSMQLPCCPVCGTSIRPGEMESHFAWEMERFCDENRKLRRSQRESAMQARKNGEAYQKKVKQEFKGNPSNHPDDTPASTRQQTYLRVCANRMARSGRSTPLKPTRSRSSQSSPVNSPLGGEEGPSGIKTTLCPVCGEVIHGNGDELNSHVETCLRKKEGGGVDDIDDTNGQEVFEEYEWAGQTRIRATTLLEGGFRASGFQTGIKRKREEEDDGDLNIDGDDSEEYGKPQYTEADVIPCSADEPDEDHVRQALRGAVISGENSPVGKNGPAREQSPEDETEDDPAETKVNKHNEDRDHQ